MKTFEDLQNIWSNQNDNEPKIKSEALIKKAEHSLVKIKKNHIGTIVTISLTIFVLVYYFFWVNASKQIYFSIGLLMMISSMLARIVIEYFSLKKFRKINPSLNFLEYKTHVSNFYKARKRIHKIYTPFIYAIYCIGFFILIPIFKANLSTGFFIYIICSGFGFLTVFAFIIKKKTNEELKLIDYLDSIN